MIVLAADWPYPRLVAHRCGGTLAPENTLAGFDACKRYGYRMVEFDAKLSADDHLFLLHDDTLDRTTNGHGPAAEHTWEELAKLDAGSWRDAAFAGERLPTLADAAARCKRDGIAANIEIKPCPGRDVITGQLVAGAALALWQGADAAAAVVVLIRGARRRTRSGPDAAARDAVRSGARRLAAHRA